MNKPFVYLSLSQGQFALIDLDDFEKVGNVKWCAQRIKTGNFYAIRKPYKGKKLWLHCEIMGIKGVDHKNGSGLDCRRENMRPATTQENRLSFRRKAINSSSQYRGVSRDHASSKWDARVTLNKVTFNLGAFKNEKDAAGAYDIKAKELGFFKEALNFPNE